MGPGAQGPGGHSLLRRYPDEIDRQIAANNELADEAEAAWLAEQKLAYANTAQRCLVTENVQGFAALAQHTTHHGILLAHPRRWPRDSSGIAGLATALDRTIREERVPGTDEALAHMRVS